MPTRSSEPGPAARSRPHVLIAQPRGDGHHLVLYVRHIVQEARRRGWVTDLLTTDEATRGEPYQLLLEEADGSLKTWIMPHVPSPRPTFLRLLRHQFDVHRALRRGYRAYRRERTPDVVFAPDVDHFAKALAVIGSPFGDTPYSGLVIGVKHHLRQMGVAATGSRNDATWARFFNRMLDESNLGALGTTDPLLKCHVAATRPCGHGKLRYVPEPGSVAPANRDEARRKLGLQPEQIAILVYGSLERRKGLDELVAALAAAEADARLVLVVAGAETPDATVLLASGAARGLEAAGRLVRRSGFMDDRVEAELFAAADIVWVGYVGFDLGSGVMILAGSARRPLIACERGLIGFRARRHELGPVVDPAATVDVVAALNRLARDADLRERYGANAAAYAARHTPERFARAACDLIDRARARTASSEA